MSNPRSIDSKQEEFKKYLESGGVTDALIRILTMIMESEERIADPLQFIRDKFEKSSPTNFELQMNQKNLESARDKIIMLEAENARLKDELEALRAKYHSLQHLTSDK